MAKGMPNAIAVIAVAERGTMFDPSAVFYMEKIAAGPEAADVIDITAPVAENIRRVAKAKRRPPRGRHRLHPRPAAARELVERGPRRRRAHQVHHRRRRRRRDHGRPRRHRRRPAARHRRHAGGHHRRVRAQAAWAASCRPGCGRATTRSGRRRIDAGHDLDRVLVTEDLVRGDDIFFCATGITDGELLRGVRYYADSVQTAVDRHAVEVSGTIRLVDSMHQLGKLRAYSAVDFDRTLTTEERSHAGRDDERDPGLGHPARLR